MGAVLYKDYLAYFRRKTNNVLSFNILVGQAFIFLLKCVRVILFVEGGGYTCRMLKLGEGQ